MHCIAIEHHDSHAVSTYPLFEPTDKLKVRLFGAPMRLAEAHKVSGSHVHVCPRPCSSTYRLARITTHRRREPHSVCCPCSHAHFGRLTTACVSSPKRLGCLRWLTHEAGHGLTSVTSLEMLAIIYTETEFARMSVPTRVVRPAGRHMYRITHTCTCK